MYYTGVDLHSDNCVLKTINKDGQDKRASKLANQPEDIINYFRSIEPDLSHHSVVVETTHNYYWFTDLLKENGIKVTLAHAYKLRAITASKVKTDKHDADTLAKLLLMNFIPEAYMVSQELRDLRDFTRTRLNLTHKRVACINSIHSLLFKYNCHPKSKTELGKQILEENFTKSIPVNHVVRYHIDVFIDQVHLLNQQIEEVEHFIKNEIKTRTSETFYQLIKMPGIGQIIAMTILLEIDDINRFPETKNLFSYAGLVPAAKNSNKSEKQYSSKQRNKFLKNALKEAAVHAIHFFLR